MDVVREVLVAEAPPASKEEVYVIEEVGELELAACDVPEDELEELVPLDTVVVVDGGCVLVLILVVEVVLVLALNVDVGTVVALVKGLVVVLPELGLLVDELVVELILAWANAVVVVLDEVVVVTAGVVVGLNKERLDDDTNVSEELVGGGSGDIPKIDVAPPFAELVVLEDEATAEDCVELWVKLVAELLVDPPPAAVEEPEVGDVVVDVDAAVVVGEVLVVEPLLENWEEGLDTGVDVEDVGKEDTIPAEVLETELVKA